MNRTIASKQIVTHSHVSMLCFFCLLFLLPQFGEVAVMTGCAAILSAYVAIVPEHFRSRSGSMKAAFYLVAAMWIAAVAITALTLLG